MWVQLYMYMYISILIILINFLLSDFSTVCYVDKYWGFSNFLELIVLVVRHRTSLFPLKRVYFCKDLCETVFDEKT